MINIANWLLTRRCNLKCSYCSIVKNYNDMPEEYPRISHYIRNEMNTGVVLEGLRRLHSHNPDIFNIFYGGEPFLRKDLDQIINFCNSYGINYTIITNNTEELNIKHFLDSMEVKGLTTSVDPILYTNEKAGDRVKKSESGLQGLVEYRSKVKDLVAEITVDKNSFEYLEELVVELSKAGISSDVTFIDISKNPYYDFSNVTESDSMVEKTEFVAKLFQKFLNMNVDIHMKDPILYEIFNILPSELDCEIEKDVHNITIDSDGSVRLCLRIRGIETPKINLLEYINASGKLDEKLIQNISNDKNKYCEGCNWTCMIMSKLISEGRDSSYSLVHKDKRGG